MKVVLVLDDGTVFDLVEDADGYNLSNPLAELFFFGTLRDSLERARKEGVADLFIARESPPICDLCDEPEDQDPFNGREYDWNGETGNHLSCERIRDAAHRLVSGDAS